MSTCHMKYGDERRVRIELRVGQTRYEDGTIIVSKPSTIEVLQRWTKASQTWIDDSWEIVTYYLDTLKEIPKPPVEPMVPWWRRLFRLGTKIPEARVVEK